MDWGRAKSVLIFSFLLLNILLGYQLYTDLGERINASVDLTDLSPETLRVMQDKGIRLSLTGKIPLGTPELQDLTYRYAANANNTERLELQTPVHSRIIFSQKELIEGLGETIPMLSEYEVDFETSTESVFVLYRKYNGLPMFDVKLEMYSSNQQITGYRQDVVENIQPGPMQAQVILSASKAIGSLIDNHLQPGAVITDIKLGYHGQDFDSDEQFAGPSWRVLLESGEVYYVHAISAEVFTDSEPEAALIEEGL